jgi:hypothetical protein
MTLALSASICVKEPISPANVLLRKLPSVMGGAPPQLISSNS